MGQTGIVGEGVRDMVRTAIELAMQQYTWLRNPRCLWRWALWRLKGDRSVTVGGEGAEEESDGTCVGFRYPIVVDVGISGVVSRMWYFGAERILDSGEEDGRNKGGSELFGGMQRGDRVGTR